MQLMLDTPTNTIAIRTCATQTMCLCASARARAIMHAHKYTLTNIIPVNAATNAKPFVAIPNEPKNAAFAYAEKVKSDQNRRHSQVQQCRHQQHHAPALSFDNQ
jgi:hypothetical protein